MDSIFWTVIILVLTIYILKRFFSGGKNFLKTDMTGKVVIITGASSGLGFQHSKNLIESNATVVFACRNEEKANDAISNLPEEKRENAKYIPLDLCNFESIKNFVKAIKLLFPEKIDILVNNAGAQPVNFNITKDNLESFIEGNHLGPMLLTFLLIDHFKPKGRIIILSSLAHFMSSLTEDSIDILSDLDKIKDYYFTSIIGKYLLYNDTKLMNLYFTNFLDEIFTKKNIPIKACCLHPGVCNTTFFNYMKHFGLLGYLYKLATPLVWIFFKNAEEGSQTQIFLSHLDYDLLKGGAYYADCQVHYKAKKAENNRIRNAIMRWSVEELKKRKEVPFIN